ncbi:MAG: hypothetical protein QOE63_387 [Acidimicrobiaceae bacterium]
MATVPAMGVRHFFGSFSGSRAVPDSRPPSPTFVLMRRCAALLGLLLLLSGCFTGKRPSVVKDPFPAGLATGDPAIDQVLAQLDAANAGPYTANYTVLTKFGNVSRPASVSVEQGRRSVTVGDVRFLTVGNASQTCLLDRQNPCSPSIQPARISDTQVTPDFYAADAAKRLRRDATAIVGKPISHVETMAGQQATCVDVPLSGGTSVFCVLSGGPLARLDDASVAIDITQFAPTVNESLFATIR